MLTPGTAQAASQEVRPRCEGRPRCHASIGAAIAAAARDPSDGWIDIRVAPGDYREKLTINRPRTRLTGAGADRTRIRFGAVAQTAGRHHRDGWGTAGSATLTIDADQVRVSGVTVENDFDYLANDVHAPGSPERIGNPQAVALLLDIHSDRVKLDSVALLGYQDTLFANGRRAWVRGSLIAGNIDFLFGNGMLWIERSEVRSRPRAAMPPPGKLQSYIAAPSTPRSQPIGIVVLRSRLTREAGVPDGGVALARPWHPTTTFADGRYADPDAIGQALFIDCFMDAHISPARWTDMAGTARDGGKSMVFRPEDARFFESGSHGPGAVTPSARPHWRPAQDIDALRQHFFTGWRTIGD